MKKLFLFLFFTAHSFSCEMQSTNQEHCRIYIDLKRFKERDVMNEIMQAYNQTPTRISPCSGVFPGELLLVDIYDKPTNILLKLRGRKWFNSKTMMHAPSKTQVKPN